MKIIRYQTEDGIIGFAQEAPDGAVTRLRGELFSGLEPTREKVRGTKLLAPLSPRSLLCVGLNYRQHAVETNTPLPQFPVLFMKGVNAVQNPGDPIVLPRWLSSTKVDFECELAVIIGRPCKNVLRAEALDYVFGYTCANDVSARDWQKEGGGSQWCRGKSFDTFAPLGPVLVTADEIPNPNALRIRTVIGDEVMQDCSTADMIFNVATLIEFLSGSTTLAPGTVILTGTPHGVGMGRKPPRFLQPGETVTVEIEGIGALSNPVIAEETAGRQSSFQL